LYTVVVTPYLSLIPELTSNLNERVDITTNQARFILLSMVLFGLAGLAIDLGGYALMGGLVALLVIFSFAPTVLFIKEKKKPPAEMKREGNLLSWIGLTFKNPAFFHLAISTAFYWFALNLMLLVVPFWVTKFLSLREGYVLVLMLPFIVMNFIFFAVFNRSSKTFGKYRMFVWIFIGSFLAFPLLALVGWLPVQNHLVQSAVVMAVIGIPVAGFYVLPNAILADVADYDRELTGQKREAMYFGVQAIFQKAMIGLSILIFGFVAYMGGADVVTEMGLKTATATAGLACLVGLAFFWKYPLREIDGRVVNIRKKKP
jgi:GPH family glycoside/pentoside/hexuronide:cation symporter